MSLPRASVRGDRAVAATADQLATQAAMTTFARGGNAVDAAIAANAAIGVTGPHLCGIGGDLFALVHDGSAVHALNASGRAGSGVDADAVRASGHTSVPHRHHLTAVTAPGCIDGWVVLHDRFGRLDLATVLDPAIGLARDGFPASQLLVGALSALDERGRSSLTELVAQATVPGARVRRPGIARTLAAVAAAGREAFYGGEFGAGLIALGEGQFTTADLERSHADWVRPLSARVFGSDVWTMPPNSQGYLLLGAARLAEHVGVPDDPDDPAWPHLLVEAAVAASHDRPDLLHEDADGEALLRLLEQRAGTIDPTRASSAPAPAADGDTTYLCTADSSGLGVSLIQSNASDFGSWIVEPSTGINLHSRGLGFSLVPGHPAELAPGRRPPHTLAPAMVTTEGHLAAILGTMGGDGQPQILLQVLTRLLATGQSPRSAIDAGRWVLRGASTGFDTWTSAEPPQVMVEGHAPDSWADGLTALGHRTSTTRAFDGAFGHAHAITVDRASGMFAAAADPRTVVGAAAAT